MPKKKSWTPLSWDLNLTQRGNVKDYVVLSLLAYAYLHVRQQDQNGLFWCGVGRVCKYRTLTHMIFNEDANLWGEYKHTGFISLLTAATCAELNSRCKG